ncbi:MAG: PAS domain-containing protein [Sphingobacteriales bacterium]|nr:PAS domain-containing protein [Sphingobacteriales bacterium]
MRTKKTVHFFFGSLRGQLILGVALVHAILMTLFIADLVSRQRKVLRQQQEEHAIALSQSLSTSAAEWLAANDIAGLQELVDAQKRYPELAYAILTDINGHILGHTDRTKAGQYLLDLPQDKKLTVISKGPDLVDVAAPAMLGGRQVGWIRVGLSQEKAGKQLAGITLSGILYALLAICIGTVIAWWMGIRITRRLYAVQDTINIVSKGDSTARSRLTGRDEAATLAKEFDSMLDTLEERNQEVQKNRALFESLFHSATVPMVYIDKSGTLLNYNHSFEKIFGYGRRDFSTFEEWWILTCPDKDCQGKNLDTWKGKWQQAAGMHGITDQQEFAVTCKSGESRTVLVSGNALAEDMLVTLMDITDLKKTEAALRKSESSLNEAQRVAHIGSWELDHTQNKLSWSEENYRIFEVNPGETPHSYETFLSLVHPDDRKFVNQMYSDSVKNHTRYDIEHRIILDGNRIKHLHEQCETIYNPQGEPVLSIGTTQDITARKQAEIKQREALERINKIAASVPGVIFQYRQNPDGSTCFPYLSEASNEIYEISPAEACRDASAIFDMHHPDDNPGILASLAESAKYLIPWQHEFRIRRKDGTVRTLYSNAVPQRENDGAVVWHGFTTDITEHKMMEEALHSSRQMTEDIIRTIPVRVFWKDSNLVYMGCNEIFARDAGYKTPMDLIGKDDYRMTWKEQAELYRKDDLQVIQTGIPKINTEEKQTTPDGHTITILTSKIPLRDSQGEIIGVLGTYMDVSVLKETEEQLNKANRLYAFISHINQMIIHAKDEEEILRETCRIAVEYGHFKMAWLGKVDEDSKKVIPLVHSGKEDGFLRKIRPISVEDIPEGRGPTGRSLREDKVVFCNDIENDPQMAPWKELALERGFRSLISLPVKKAGRIYSVFTLYAPGKDYFNPEEIELLRDVTRELSFALQAVENEQERKRAEKQVKDYIYALNQSSIVDVSDAAGNIQFANDNFLQTTGYSMEELKGRGHNLLRSGYHSKEYYRHLWDTVLQGKVWRGEFRNKAKNGSFHWVDTTIVPFLNEEGKPFQFITIRSDITKRKEAEVARAEALERYDLLTRASSDTIWDWHIATGEIIYNQGLSKTFGYQVSSINSKEQWWEKNIHPDDFDRVQYALNNAFLRQKEFIQFDYRFRCADGSYKYVKDRAFVMYNEKGEPERMIGSMSDITQEIEFASRIEKAVIDAQEKEWNQIGMELHDNVNQLLAASLLYLSFGMEKQKEISSQPSSELQKCESHIREAIQEIRKLSHQLAPASSRELSLEEIFRSLLDTLPGNKLHISLDIKDIKERQIDPELRTNLYRILQEQLNNIIKYSQASEIKISLKEKKSMLIFRISDNGVGFDPGIRRKGIGLENIRRRAKAFSGEFKLRTAPGQGCEVIISIPMG